MKHIFAVMAIMIVMTPAATFAATPSVAELQSEILSLQAELERLNNVLVAPVVSSTVVVDGMTIVDATVASAVEAYRLCTTYGLGTEVVDIFVECSYDGEVFFHLDF